MNNTNMREHFFFNNHENYGNQLVHKFEVWNIEHCILALVTIICEI